jgi:hypothetical protein
MLRPSAKPFKPRDDAIRRSGERDRRSRRDWIWGVRNRATDLAHLGKDVELVRGDDLMVEQDDRWVQCHLCGLLWAHLCRFVGLTPEELRRRFAEAEAVFSEE